MIEVQRNNPLHGVKLEALLTELVEHYGWEAMAEEFNFNCFKSNPSIKSSLKFLRKTQWAREKVESFYLYRYKGLPRPGDKEFELPPRDRTITLSQKPGAPAPIKPRKAKAPAAQSAQKTSGNANGDKGGGDSNSQNNDVWSHWRK